MTGLRAVGTIAALVAAVALASTSCSSGNVSDSATSAERPTITTTPAARPAAAELEGIPDDWTPPALEWTGCSIPRGGECASLRVPLDWSDPTGSTLILSLARLPGGEKPLLTNPGGPGGSGLEFLASSPFGEAITSEFTVVSWDPRGVGRSTSVTCATDVADFLAIDSSPDSPEEQRSLDDAASAVAEECGELDGHLLPHVGTADVARDMEAIRRALGDQPLDYVGFSYGTQIGQVYAAMYPDRIRTMVLDGVVDPAASFTEFLVGQAEAFESAFDQSAAGCARAGVEACGVDDLAAAYDEVSASVEAAPLRGAGGAVGPSELATAAIYTGYTSDGWRILGPALTRALDGDGGALRRLADSYHDLGAYGSYAAVVCVDTPAPRGPEAYRAFAEEATRSAPRFGAAVANEMLPCATWPVPPSGPPTGVVARGAPPILVIGNTGDPATPLANARAVADRLDSGVLVVAELDGHTAYGADSCVTRIVERYLVDLEVPPTGTTC